MKLSCSLSVGGNSGNKKREQAVIRNDGEREREREKQESGSRQK